MASVSRYRWDQGDAAQSYQADDQYAAVLKPVIRTILESSDLSSMYVVYSTGFTRCESYG